MPNAWLGFGLFVVPSELAVSTQGQMPSTRGAFKNTFVDTDEDGDGDDTVIIHDEAA